MTRIFHQQKINYNLFMESCNSASLLIAQEVFAAQAAPTSEHSFSQRRCAITYVAFLQSLEITFNPSQRSLKKRVPVCLQVRESSNSRSVQQQNQETQQRVKSSLSTPNSHFNWRTAEDIYREGLWQPNSEGLLLRLWNRKLSFPFQRETLICS